MQRLETLRNSRNKCDPIMTLFDQFIEELLKKEGGYVNDSRDSGGATKYGITEAVARAAGWQWPMNRFPLSFAKDIYKAKYWDALRLDEVQNLCPALCLKLADIGVNMGTGQAGTFLQRLLNSLNNEGKLYPDIKVDGSVGPATIGTLKKYLTVRAQHGETVMVKALNCLQGAFYITLAERRQKDEAFLYGWLLNRID